VLLCGAGAALHLEMFLHNNVMLQFFLFWLFGLAMTSFACCTSVFLQSSQSAGNASLAMILVRGRLIDTLLLLLLLSPLLLLLLLLLLRRRCCCCCCCCAMLLDITT
jgi:hypothetical protein